MAGEKFITLNKIDCLEIGILKAFQTNYIFLSHKSLSAMHIYEVWLHSLQSHSISIADSDLCGKLEQLLYNLNSFRYRT